jgi:hypothetical protein
MERLNQTRSRWYLTWFLVPKGAGEEHRRDPTSNDELGQSPEPMGPNGNNAPEKTAARRPYLPSSMGISVLLPSHTHWRTSRQCHPCCSKLHEKSSPVLEPGC